MNPVKNPIKLIIYRAQDPEIEHANPSYRVVTLIIRLMILTRG